MTLGLQEYEKTVATLVAAKKPVVTYCALTRRVHERTVRRSCSTERGVKDVRALAGGWNIWVDAKGAVVTGK